MFWGGLDDILKVAALLVSGTVTLLRRHKNFRFSLLIINSVIIAISLSTFIYMKYMATLDLRIGDIKLARDGEIFGMSIASVIFLGIILISYTSYSIKVRSTLSDELSIIYEERKNIEEKVFDVGNRDIMHTIQLNLNQINEYYMISKSQARSSFVWSVLAFLFGFTTIIGGIWMFYAGQSNITLASISAIAGVISQFIGGAYIYIYNKSLYQLNLFHSQLVRLQDVMLSIKLAGDMPNEQRKLAMTEKIIGSLLGEKQTLATGSPTVQDVPKRSIRRTSRSQQPSEGQVAG